MKNLRLFVRCNVVSHNVGEINEIICVFMLCFHSFPVVD